MNFTQRSYKKELLDGTNIPFADIERNMQELDTINHFLGGHKITLKGMRNLMAATPNKPALWRIAEIGCGGGDNLSVVKDWAANHGIAVQLTGVDINQECITFAKSQPQNKDIDFICTDYRDAHFEEKPHIIFSSLFCHHFTHTELVEMMQWKYQNSLHGFFINDLQRHPVAYHSIKLLTSLFSKSYLVKNDAPLSVLRGFTKEEWNAIFKEAGITNFNCSWQWAFRWLLTCLH